MASSQKKFLLGHLSRGSRSYTQPLEVAYFSRNTNGLIYNDKSELHQFQAIPNGTDLMEGFDPNASTNNRGARLDPVITSILNSPIACQELSRAQIVTYRNNLNKILSSPYRNEDWTIELFRFHDRLFLHVVECDSDSKKEEKSYLEKKFIYIGRKFEALCTGESQVNSGAEFCSIISARLGSVRILLSAEIDCWSNSQHIRTNEDTRPSKRGRVEHESSAEFNRFDPPHSSYMELKTHRLCRNANDVASLYRYKMMNVWIQSYLAGVSRIFFGFRDENGILQDSKEFDTLSIPRMAQEESKGRPFWSSNTCLFVGGSILEWFLENSQNGSLYRANFNCRQKEITLEYLGDECDFLDTKVMQNLDDFFSHIQDPKETTPSVKEK